MRTAVLLALASLLAAFVPAVQAHGLVNAGELETLFVQDEASDVMTETDLGYDLLQIYVGEAWMPKLGDGLYVHTVLYGGAGSRPALDGRMSVRFTFTTDGGDFTRTLTTTDGTTFTSDFDSLAIATGDGEVEVQRAFVVYPSGVGPGTILKAVKAESYVDDDLRDVAPGGAYLQGVPITEPMSESKQVIESYTLKGPTGYVEATSLGTLEDGGFTLSAHNPLKKGDQHIMVLLPLDLHGWTADVTPGHEVKAGQSIDFQLHLKPGDGPLAIDLASDIGGHVPLTAHVKDGHIVLSSPDQEARVAQSGGQEAPAPTFPILAATMVLAALALRRKA